MALDFGTGGLASADYLIDADGGGSILTWTLETDMGGNPVARYVGLMMDGMIGPAYEQGLNNLKDILENQPSPEPGPAIMEAPGDPEGSGATQAETRAT